MVDYLVFTDPPEDPKARLRSEADRQGLKAMFRNRDGKQYLTLKVVRNADLDYSPRWHEYRYKLVHQFFPDARCTSGGFLESTYRLNKDEPKPAKKPADKHINLKLTVKEAEYLFNHLYEYTLSEQSTNIQIKLKDAGVDRSNS